MDNQSWIDNGHSEHVPENKSRFPTQPLDAIYQCTQEHCEEVTRFLAYSQHVIDSQNKRIDDLQSAITQQNIELKSLRDLQDELRSMLGTEVE